jgi:2-polyprenyl-6-methoxyphenol hydroxylase-like FAD-dependent oxidoreductase
MMMMHRPDLLQTLYDTLSTADKARVSTGKRVVEIVSNEDGVIVTCDDGTSFNGSVVIGADGVHSLVRDEMRRLALMQSPTAVVNDKHPLLTTFRCLFGTTSLIPGLMVSGESWGGHGNGLSTQLFVGRDKAWFFVYERLDQPRKETVHYSAKDASQYAERLGHLSMTDKLTFKDVYAVTRNCGLTDLEEGTMKVFSWDRLALIGDAVNKQTPNVGNGYNSGVQDLVVLTTGFRRLLDKEPSGTISTESIKEVLRDYQTTREQDAIETHGKSARATRMQTWSTWFLWLMERYVVPLAKLDRFFFSKVINEWVSNGRVLPFLEEKSLQWGKIPWVNLPEVGDHKLGSESS